MVPERFLEDRFISVIGGTFEQFCCGFLNHELLKLLTEAKALKRSACSAVVLHVDFAEAKSEKIRRKLNRILSIIFSWDVELLTSSYHFVILVAMDAVTD